MIRFYLTGRVAVEGQRTLDQTALAGRQGKLCLVKLVLERHRPVPTDELADALWPSSPPTSSDISLRVLISKLRAALGRVADADVPELVSDSGCYQLRAAGAWVDIEEAANAVDRAEGAQRAGDLETAWSQATVAAAIGRRPLLPGEDEA